MQVSSSQPDTGLYTSTTTPTANSSPYSTTTPVVGSGESQTPSTNVQARTIEHHELYESLVMSLLWKQRSAAGHAAIYQSFQQLEQAFRDKADAQPGIIVIVQDLDDGSVESTPYFASFVDSNKFMTVLRSEEWWRNQMFNSYPLSGSKTTLEEVLRNPNARVAYLSSRGALENIQPITQEMLQAFGFPINDRTEVRIAIPGSFSKPQHLTEIQQHCDDALFVGDKLSDYCKPLPKTPEGLEHWVTREQRDKLGKEFILVTNPVYGPSWEKITHNLDGKLSAETLSEQREQQLNAWTDDQLPEATQNNPLTKQILQALLYVQSASYKALTIQTCNRAAIEFGRAMQKAPQNPVAVVSVDGTALNNSPWVAGICQKGHLTDDDSFDRWTLTQQAQVKEGMKDLADTYHKHDVPVIWLTDRPASSSPDKIDDIRQATEEHLRKTGLFQPGDKILFKDEQPDNRSDCMSAIRAGQYTDNKPCSIVQVVSDNLDDLEIDRTALFNPDTTHWPQEAKELGSSRILIANPIDVKHWHRSLVEHWLNHSDQQVREEAEAARQDPQKLAVLNKKMMHRWLPTSESKVLH